MTGSVCELNESFNKMTVSLVYLYYILMTLVDTVILYVNKFAKYIYIGVNIVSLINNIVDTIDRYGENLPITICLCVYYIFDSICKVYKVLKL